MASWSGDPPRPEDSGLSDEYEDMPQLVTRRLSDLANALVSGVQAQPIVAAAVIAAGVGVLIGVSFARRSRSQGDRARSAVAEELQTAARRATRAGRKSGRALDYGELVPLAMKLWENPVVRGYALRTATRMLAKRFK